MLKAEGNNSIRGGVLLVAAVGQEMGVFSCLRQVVSPIYELWIARSGSNQGGVCHVSLFPALKIPLT